MNKKNKILVGCLALLLVLSVGYALFSETITINGTATAKGSFDLTTTCVSGLDSDYADFVKVNEGYTNNEIGYEKDTCTVINDNEVSLGVNLLYPSAQKFFTMYVKNTGTIPAQINGNTDIKITHETCADADNNGEMDQCFDERFKFITVFPVGAIKADGTKVPGNSSDYAEFNDASTGTLTLKPNETVVAVAAARWLDYDDEEYYNNVLWRTTVTATFDFKQVTN